MSNSRTKSRSKTPESILVEVPASPSHLIEEIELDFPEPLPNVITYDEKVALKMEKTFKLHNRLEPFMGKRMIENLFYLYLFNKYKMNCVVTDTTGNRIGIEILISDKPEISDILTRQKDNFVIKLFNCIKNGSEVVIIPISLQINISGRLSGHANLLIYRKNKNELEHFEPHGERFEGCNNSVVIQKLSYFIESAVAQLNFKIRKDKIPGIIPIVFVKAHNVCPRKFGVQLLEGDSLLPKNVKEPLGYCSAWSMFFTELCLKNPEIPSRQIYEAVFKKGDLYRNQNDYYRSVIRGYTCFINNKISKYFTEVFEEPITSKSVIKQAKRASQHVKEGKSPEWATRLMFDKMNEIMEVELGLEQDTLEKYEGDEEVRHNYEKSKLKNTIKEDTSSSDSVDFKSKVRSPKRIHSTGSKSRGSKTVKK
jgi:hypothetical protein